MVVNVSCRKKIDYNVVKSPYHHKNVKQNVAMQYLVNHRTVHRFLHFTSFFFFS